jgi:hypothetical protein
MSLLTLEEIRKMYPSAFAVIDAAATPPVDIQPEVPRSDAATPLPMPQPEINNLAGRDVTEIAAVAGDTVVVVEEAPETVSALEQETESTQDNVSESEESEIIEAILKHMRMGESDEGVKEALKKEGFELGDDIDDLIKKGRVKFADQLFQAEQAEDEAKQTAGDAVDRRQYAEDELYLQGFCHRNNTKVGADLKQKLADPAEMRKYVETLQKREAKKQTASESKWEYALTPEEFEAEMEKDYPVVPLIEQAGPSWDDEIFYGPAGQLTKKACQYNEAHPVGVLLDFLVSLGNLFGRHAHFSINATTHHTNEFVARIGETSRSRKGSGRDAINEVLRFLDADWFRDRVQSGFGSGQAIVDQLRDSMTSKITNTKLGTTKDVVVPGVSDKRLFIREDELVS